MTSPGREARWFLTNYILMNLVALALGVAVGVSTMMSSGGTIAGYGGSTVEQVFWFAVGAVWFTTLVYGIPVLIAFLVLWRVAIRLVGHPRLSAFFLVGILALVAAMLIANPVPAYAALTALALLAFAAIVRTPTWVGKQEQDG